LGALEKKHTLGTSRDKHGSVPRAAQQSPPSGFDRLAVGERREPQGTLEFLLVRSAARRRAEFRHAGSGVDEYGQRARGSRRPEQLRGRCAVPVIRNEQSFGPAEDLAQGAAERRACRAWKLAAPASAVDANDLLPPGVDTAGQDTTLARGAVAGLEANPSARDAGALEFLE
jgi:hypothetical protein